MMAELCPATLATLVRLERSNWLSMVGVKDTTKALVLSSWSDAIASETESDWQDIKLEAANRFRVKLLRQDKTRFNQWNSIVDRVKPIVLELVERKTSRVVLQESLPKAFLDAVQWDILHLFMETEFSDLIEPAFYAGTAYWYASGHFPCGWEGELPAGRPIIY
jgi:hypothetical protein